jgi:gamma-glutamylcyclotransferase (GGCT)/AIG2-like uncharacterized protein YtfP
VNSSEASRHLFAYGSLVDPACLDAVLGHKHGGERLAARLAGYQRVMRPTSAYPFIIEAEGASVEGVLVMDLSPCDMQVLDRYEEVDAGVYHREPVQVEAWGCGPRPMHVRAEAYVAGPSTPR